MAFKTNALKNPILGGSGVVKSRVISPLIWVISIVTRLITLLITTLNPKPYRTLKGALNPLQPLLITTHEPPSNPHEMKFWFISSEPGVARPDFNILLLFLLLVFWVIVISIIIMIRALLATCILVIQ